MINSFKIFTVLEKRLEMTIVKCLSGVLIALTIWAGLLENIQKYWATRQVMISNLAKTDGNKQMAPHYRNKTIQSNL